MPATETKSWDIFCRVIDNYGDIGVCWRLARQLANEHRQHVRLWVDDMDSLARIWPEAQILEHQFCNKVEICRWIEPFPANIEVAQVVIEGFACDIPDTYLQAMAAQKHAGHPPVWINLEYLSAEQWVEECHGMTSIHPATGLRKTFFFPGFTPKTGGLLREHDLLARRESFDKPMFLEKIGVQQKDASLLVSLFAYENPAIAPLLNTWINSPTPIHCLVPGGKILTSINQSLEANLDTGKQWQQGNLFLTVIPFLTQVEYDLLLWACDINFVRGEDSFIRAQWAGKPFIWHIYPQDEQAHIVKLDAFLDKFLAGKNAEFANRLRSLWHNWNEFADTSNDWSKMLEYLSQWQFAVQEWSLDLSQQPDLARQLMALAVGYAPQKSTTEKL
ncbi:elongation factor P maturation arginine rhamnosyltransferase EarP [Cellvibrio mixtus]|uniref:elongation factor P maturation arginine rhamnosyltransferase EarP n=1 Tax=Cellvibrio mixtus TaxID=39650 RepID=UPI0005878138|nr:elongation factor P maturation arginine rhamnosyltransferase EarP [Cellvibrio mixtus]